ncbi:ComC/BlpC family leader-containing pheromone/bacteriocin [Marinifilum fragile]|nr:ComC/BlpC family leader-containing pheromone/bacteriocin [Marinifilum fragile]
MKKKKNIEVFEKLNQSELSNIKGGEEREYYYVIIGGKKVKVYIN